MSQRNWNIIVALVAGLMVTAAASKPNNQRQDQQSKATQTFPSLFRPSLGPIQEPDKTPDLDRPCEQGRDDRKSDLCAQWKAADAAEKSAEWTRLSYNLAIVGTGIAFLTLVAAGIAALYAKRAADETKRGADMAERVLRTLERPWLKISVEENKDFFNNGVRFTITNEGRAAAFVGVIQLDFIVSESLPNQFVPQTDHDTMGVRNILPSGGKGETCDWPLKIDSVQKIQISAGTTQLYFFAIASYRDSADNWYTTGTALVFDKEFDGLVGVGGDSHNFMT